MKSIQTIFILVTLAAGAGACTDDDPTPPEGWLATGGGEFLPAWTEAGEELQMAQQFLREDEIAGSRQAVERGIDALRRRASVKHPKSAQQIEKAARELEHVTVALKNEKPLWKIRPRKVFRRALLAEAGAIPARSPQSGAHARQGLELLAVAREGFDAGDRSGAALFLQLTAGALRFMGSMRDVEEPRAIGRAREDLIELAHDLRKGRTITEPHFTARTERAREFFLELHREFPATDAEEAGL